MYDLYFPCHVCLLVLGEIFFMSHARHIVNSKLIENEKFILLINQSEAMPTVLTACDIHSLT